MFCTNWASDMEFQQFPFVAFPGT